LASFHRGEVPAVASVAVVPVGLTRFRPQKTSYTCEPRKAREVIHQVITPRQTSRLTGVYFVWLADEWFLIAGQELPPESDYEDYPQIDNGVGSIRSFLKQFSEAAQQLP